MEDGEKLIDAAIRETLEETAYVFTPEAVSGIYRLPVPEKDLTYLRFAFIGTVEEQPLTGYQLDKGIIRALWLTKEEVMLNQSKLRSHLVLTCIEDYLAGHRYPLSILRD